METFFSIGGASHDRVEVRMKSAQPVKVGDRYDWIGADVSISTQGFSALFAMSLLPGELITFHHELAALHRTLRGTASFQTLEGQLSLVLTGDGRGNIAVHGEGRELPGNVSLKFKLAIDQTYLAASLEQLGSVIDSLGVPLADHK
jgi:hypothetical protein